MIQQRLALLQDATNATLRSETLRETVCDAIITNDGIRKPSKMCIMFAMTDASNMVQILVACAMQGIWLIQQNCLRWGRTTEMGSHINVCAIYGIQFAPMNYLLLGSATETVSQIKVCVIYGIRFTRMNCFQLGNTTETVQLNKMCVIRGKQPTRMNCLRWEITT